MNEEYCRRAVEVLSNVLKDRELNESNLIGKVCEEAGIQPDELLRKTKLQRIVTLKRGIEYLFRNMYGFTCVKTAARVDLHHSSVIVGVQEFEKYLRERKISLPFNSAENGREDRRELYC